MSDPFFSPMHIQVLHVFLETYIEHPSQHDVQELFAPFTHQKQSALSPEDSPIPQLEQAWSQFCRAPYNPQFCKVLCNATYRSQKTPPDRIALVLIAQILCTLNPQDEEAKTFLNTLSIPQKNTSWSTIILCLLILFLMFTYHQTSKKITIYDLPDVELEVQKKSLPVIWTTKEDYGIVFHDQGSHMSKIEDSVYSFVLLTQLQNKGTSSLVYMEGVIKVYDQADQLLCTEPITALEEQNGPLYPGDDGYLSTEIQCSAIQGSKPSRVTINILNADVYSSFTKPELAFVSTFPISPLSISKRFYSISPIEGGFWIHNQFVIKNQEETPKSNIRIRIHYYNEDETFLAIEERHVLRPNTNILPPKRHMLHSIGVRVQKEPYRMDIEVVDCE